MVRAQAVREFEVETPLGEDKLLFSRMIFREELSGLFRCELNLLSEDNAVDFDQILGKECAVRIDAGKPGERFVHGYCNALSQVGTITVPDGAGTERRLAHYEASLVPWLWFLTRTSDCRIFQTKPVPDIIQAVFDDNGFSNHRLELRAQYPKLEYCVQYRETDLHFVSRLMEQYGIYYYFEHTRSSHTLVLADAPSCHAPCPQPTLRFVPKHEQIVGSPGVVQSWSVQRSVKPGSYALRDYNFEKPKPKDIAGLEATDSQQNLHANADWEMYDYPGEYTVKAEGDTLARIRLEEIQADFETAAGTTDSRSVSVGATFQLESHPRSDQNAEYLVLAATHMARTNLYASGNAGGEATMTTNFEAIPSAVAYRPRRRTPKPSIAGPQTAVVVGPEGEEIHVDEHGRVKVQFHWDRYGEYDENSSCWIRVSESWAGRKWGAVFTPRIGQEVIVEFLEGDPDRPIITGRVYNAVQQPPYPLPDRKTVSTVKTLSSADGKGWNELRFEDKKGEEQIFLHSERNFEQRTRHDHLEWTGGDKHVIIGEENYDGEQKRSLHELVHGEHHQKVVGDHVEHVGGSYKLLVGDGDGDGHADIIVRGDSKRTVEGEEHHKAVMNLNQSVGQSHSLDVAQDIHHKAGMNYALDAGMNLHIKAGMAVVIEAGAQVSLKVGGNFVDITPAGVAINGTTVLINSGGAAGSGAGSSPTAPTDAAQAQPTEPNEAENAQPGQVSAYE